MNEKQKYYLNKLQTIVRDRGGELLSSEYVTMSTRYKCKCSNGHVWESKGNKIQQGRWCPYCAGRHRTIEYVQNIAMKHGGEVLDSDFHGMSYKYLWRCKEEHEWRSKLDNVVHLNRWCPYCAGNPKDTMEHMYELAIQKNGQCLGSVYNGHDSHLLWECSCGYQWKCTPKNIKKGKWCPKCAGKLTPTVEEAQKLAIFRMGKLLTSVVESSSENLVWECNKGHSWESSWNNISGSKSWCPYCSNQKVCDDNCLATLNPELAKEWHPTKNESLTPFDITPGSGKKAWWQCLRKGHEWKAVVANRSNGKDCPYCNIFKTEQKCRLIFESIFNVPFARARPFGGHLELDGYCKQLNLAFEYNGKQHYEFVQHWQKKYANFEKQQARDIKKARLCEEKGIELIVIPYTENHRLEEFIEEQLLVLNL